jgi:hypothetical protein
VANTCSKRFDLPKYTAKSKLKDKLEDALVRAPAEGFGLG